MNFLLKCLIVFFVIGNGVIIGNESLNDEELGFQSDLLRMKNKCIERFCSDELTTQKKSNWKVYKHNNGYETVSLMFPKSPSVEIEDGFVFAECEVGDGALYKIATLEQGVLGMKEFMDELFWEYENTFSSMGFTVNKVIANTDGKAVYKEVSAYIEGYGSRIYVKGRIYVTESSFYDVSVYYLEAEKVDFNKFFNSFSVK